MSNTIRIRTTPNGSDSYLKVKLEQDFDFIEILSLKISQEDTYRKFCSDYGTIVGRVIINNGFGVPNAKVSVFIPLDDIDKNDPLIKGLYPFEVITDKDNDGIRYNLLPKDADPTNECFTPIGTFPSKREVLDNDTLLSVYCKYYKFTTTTNHAGDFMLFGVPLGTYTVHVDADMSDIGIGSQRPYDLISQGTPSKLFYSPTKFKEDKNLDKLIQVKSMNAGVNVQPFWGDSENCEIGITRLDFDLNYSLRPAAIFMGSIYGDQHKHSVNKRCRPRKKLGEVCEQVTEPGSINMIRKTLDGQIEDFDVEGGRVIDDDGTWAYQIPMNLDYMVTDEEGNLILSQDPNFGVPTRARVRFNIGMDETGGEGRLRTRARYLVPNNPTNPSEIDYTFDSTTKDTSFRDLYWNKIYSVSNFVSRFQKELDVLPVKTRAMTGMKNVDACAGDKTPFPYNRVNTELNPIFFIICLIIKIIAFLIYIMNFIFIPLINTIIDIINSVIGGIVSVINTIISAVNSLPGVNISTINFSPIPHVGCLTVKCPEDDTKYFAPGCKSGTSGFNAANPHPDFYCGDSVGHSCTLSDYAVGLDDCIAFEMAKTLDLFQFDFYNDWVNGTLFGFLLKYKKKKKGREIFCEYDCQDFGGGVDGNNNGVGDNSCFNNLLLDTCFDNTGHYNLTGTNYQSEMTSFSLRDGLIKKVGDEFFYAATTHDTNYKLFATELITLGSVFECDWQGIPMIQPYLIPTTYKIPPDVLEFAADNITVETCGMVSIGGSTRGLFFDINCLGLHVDYEQCLNLRHICEMGVDIDEAQEDAFGNITVQSDCIIGVSDIDDNHGKFFRDVYYGLNNSATPWVGITNLTIPPLGFTTNFNTGDLGNYDFTNSSQNGVDYVNFRNYSFAGIPQPQTNFGQPSHSFYFYFGILPGKTALDKMNQRFFTHCNAVTRNDLLIQSTTTATTTSTSSDGCISFTFVGGTAPYSYTLAGVSPTIYGPTSGTTNPTQTICGLAAGTYIITGTDSLGNPVSQTVVVPPPPSLYCAVAVTQNATSSISNDGQITISALGGGLPPYIAEVKTFLGATVFGPTTITAPTTVTGLAVDNINGYKVIITDSASNTCITTGLTITGPNPLILSASTHTNVVCYGDFSGVLNLSATGGQPPLTINTTGPAGYTSTSLIMGGLQAGVYTTTVVDALATTVTLTSTISQPPAPLLVAKTSTAIMGQQCDPNNYDIPFYITSAPSVISPGSVSVEYSVDSPSSWVSTGMTYVNSTTPLVITLPNGSFTSYVRVRYKNGLGCYSNYVDITIAEVALPPAFLTLNTIGINNVKQCTPMTAVFGFNISYLTRAPYSVSYTINGGPAITTTTSSNPTTITTAVPLASPSSNNILVTVTDSKGCVSPVLPLTITVPATTLTCNIVTTGSGPYTHTVSATGGIGPYTGTGTFNDLNPTYTAIITDSVGCTATATG